MRCPDCLPNEGCNARPWYLMPFLSRLEVFTFSVFCLIFMFYGLIAAVSWASHKRLREPVTHITVPVKYHLQPAGGSDDVDP